MKKINYEDKIKIMSEGGHLLADALAKVVAIAKPGITTLELDKEAEKWLLATGGKCAFKTVEDYRWSTCININDGIVHGIPNKRVIKDGDVVSIDIGLLYKGYFTDTSTSLIAGNGSKENMDLLNIGKLALDNAIAEARIGNRIGHISLAIQNTLNEYGLRAIPELTGHGVGEELHEKPFVPGYLVGDVMNTPVIYEGQTLAIEVIYTSGSPKMIIEDDGWTISTKDGKISGLFEETVAVLKDGPRILTLPTDNNF